MPDLEMLNRLISDSGYKLVAIAKRLDVSRVTLWKKLRGDFKITLAEANKLAAMLGMSDEQKVQIFLPGDHHDQ